MQLLSKKIGSEMGHFQELAAGLVTWLSNIGDGRGQSIFIGIDVAMMFGFLFLDG